MAGQKYELTGDTFYCGYFNGQPVTTTLKKGEVCEYFAHSDTYLFEGRESLEGGLGRLAGESESEGILLLPCCWRFET